MIIEILFIYIVYLVILILGSYYVNLYISKDQFTKDELKNMLPYLSELWNRISNNYSMLILGITMFVSSLVGLMLPLLSPHWFLNSSIIFLVMFFTFPLAKKSFDRAKVTTGGGFSDTAIDMFVRYHHLIVIGFGAGTATALMYNWGGSQTVHFLWFLINFIALSILIGVSINNVLKQ